MLLFSATSLTCHALFLDGSGSATYKYKHKGDTTDKLLGVPGTKKNVSSKHSHTNPGSGVGALNPWAPINKSAPQ